MLSVRPVTQTRLLARVSPAIVVAALAFSCGLSEVFSSAAPGDVSFVWEGDTVVRNGDSIPVHVAVLVQGERLREPRLQVAVALTDTAILALNVAGDSLLVLGRRSGRGDVVVALLTSLTTGERIDSVFTIRVQGGGPPGP